MIWRRSFKANEIVFDNEKGCSTLINADVFSLDFAEYKNKAKLVYVDPPKMEKAVFKQRVGNQDFQKNRSSLDIDIAGFLCENKAEYINKLEKLARIAKELLSDDGSLFFHVDQAYQAELKLVLDRVFGEENLVNQIVWRYNTGGKSKTFFSKRYDIIYYYSKSADRYFDLSKIPAKNRKDSQNHMKKGVDEKGKSFRSIVSKGREYKYYDDEPLYPDDVWDDVSNLANSAPQKTGFFGQKPTALLERILLCSTKKGDLFADLCSGSGTGGLCALKHGRKYIGVDISKAAIALSQKRLIGSYIELKNELYQGDCMLHASLDRGLGFYEIELSSFIAPGSAKYQGLEFVDQWYAGLINEGKLTIYEGLARSKQSPDIEKSLKVPMLKGYLALLVVDALGRQTVWALGDEI